jgi:hypothetical protein
MLRCFASLGAWPASDYFKIDFGAKMQRALCRPMCRSYRKKITHPLCYKDTVLLKFVPTNKTSALWLTFSDQVFKLPDSWNLHAASAKANINSPGRIARENPHPPRIAMIVQRKDNFCGLSDWPARLRI